MQAFFVRWRRARQFREYELFADAEIGECLLAALEAGGGWEVWQSGTLWKCPGCGDRTIRTEEFLEGLRRAELALQGTTEWQRLTGDLMPPVQQATLAWLAEIAAQMFGCERDRVYIKDAGENCRFAQETYISRV